jgi:hypothetical protein
LAAAALTIVPMVILAAALITAAPHAQHSFAVAQATATIRIVTAVRVRLDGSDNPGLPRARRGVIKSVDGTARPAELIEFQ